MSDLEKQKYAIKRTVDRVDQALNYIRDAVEYLARARTELLPQLCSQCPKEAGFNKGGLFYCGEHLPPDIIKPKDSVKIEEVKNENSK